VPYEHGGHDVTFPHRLPGRSSIAEDIQNYPWMDSLTLAFALDGTQALGLGRRAGPDLLLISLSATDAVGHTYGPDSREIHDQILRLDRWLGWFFDSLAVTVPRSRTLVVLTADHGVQSFPQRAGTERVWLGDLARSGWRFGSGLMSADTTAIAARGERVDQVAAALAAKAARRPGVARVFTPASLAAAPPTDTLAMLWRHSIPPGYGWLIAAAIQPGFVWSRPDEPSAEHGSTAPLDLTVPIVVAGPGVRHAVVHRTVRTADIAPTLAILLGVRPAERLDGEPLREIVPRAGQ
jgi:arylsulfatase A-like enzyme